MALHMTSCLLCHHDCICDAQQMCRVAYFYVMTQSDNAHVSSTVYSSVLFGAWHHVQLFAVA